DLADLPIEGVSHDPEIAKQVLLRRGDVPHLTGFSRATLKPGQTAYAHQHSDMFEVFFVQSGTGVITIAGSEHALAPGVCVLVEPTEEHEISNGGPEDLVLNYFGVEDNR
ncbi:MAG: cupin domain-containing protein, partial [Chthoniobacterales bacterium]